MLDPKKIRRDFPILKRKIGKKDLVFLDNASTTQKPQVVIDAIKKYYSTTNANIHRGVYTLSAEATEQYEATRKLVAGFINAPQTKEIIFTKNTTEAINLVSQSWGRQNLKKGDEILLTEMEHHSNLVPWQQIAGETGAALKFVPIDLDGRLVFNEIKNLVSIRTKVMTLTHVSNVLGTINPVKKINAAVKKINPDVVVLVDGAQAAGHFQVDVQDLGVDFYAFSAHKMLGPTGVGVLWGREGMLTKMPPFLTGGDMISEVTLKTAAWNDLPWKFEAGTSNIAGVVAFKEAIKYLQKIGLDNIRSWEEQLTALALKELTKIDGLTVYGPKNTTERIGVISFNLGKIHPHDVATILDEGGIAVRSGHHCAMPLMSRLGIKNTVRASFYLYNTNEEIDKLINGLNKAKKVFSKK